MSVFVANQYLQLLFEIISLFKTEKINHGLLRISLKRLSTIRPVFESVLSRSTTIFNIYWVFLDYNLGLL